MPLKTNYLNNPYRKVYKRLFTMNNRDRKHRNLQAFFAKNFRKGAK